MIIVVDDKIQYTKRCELSAVIITVHGGCQLGGCMYNLGCLVGVFPSWCFLYAGMVLYKILLVYICCTLVGLDNKNEINIVLHFVTPRGTLFFVFVLTNFYDVAVQRHGIGWKHVEFYALHLYQLCMHV